MIDARFDRCPACRDLTAPCSACFAAACAVRSARADDPRLVGTFASPDVRGLLNVLRASPHYRTDAHLRATVEHIERSPDVLAVVAAALLAGAEDRARLTALASRAASLNGPVILAPVDAFAAPAHNPGARVVATGGGR